MGESLAHKLLTLEQWCVGWAKVEIANFLAAPGAADFHWLKPRRRRELFADPFGVEDSQGHLTILAERMIHGRTKGRLVTLDAETGAAAPLLTQPHHLSYPFVVEDRGRRFVVPEQAESGALSLYPFDDASLGPPAARIEGLDAIDPTFLRRDGRWWLFCTRRSAGVNGPLFLYSAEELFGPYTPHPLNPIVTAPSRARPAGRIIALPGRLIRPGQDCSASYGAAITLSEIEVLTPELYEERPIGRIAPRDVRGGYTEGLHTLDHTAHHVLIDTKRFALAPDAIPVKLGDRAAGRR